MLGSPWLHGSTHVCSRQPMGEDVVLVLRVVLVSPPEADRLLAKPVPLAFRIELVVICVGTEECIPPLLPTRRLGVHDGIGLRVASIGQLAHLLASAVLVVGACAALLPHFKLSPLAYARGL